MTTLKMWTLFASSSLILAGNALAATGQASGSANANSTVRSEAWKAGTDAQANVHAQAAADLEARRKLAAVREKAANVKAATRAKAEAKLDAASRKVDETVAREGEVRVATRLAGEFGVDAATLVEERQSLGVTWGDLVIAHTLAASSKSQISATQLVGLEREGLSWGQIAGGLELHLSDVAGSVNAETKVAQGLAKADGRVTAVRGAGSNAGLAGTVGVASGRAGAGAGVGTGIATGGVGAGAGIGIKIGR